MRRRGAWISEDPIGFAAADANLYRYVGNQVTVAVDPSGLESPFWEGIKAFGHELFVNEIYGGGKALVNGDAGRALADRAVGIVETQTGRPFSGTGTEWGRFTRGVAGEMVGVNSLVEGVSGYDISNQRQLDGWERSRRAAAGTASLAGATAGGIYAAGRMGPGTFPTAARASGFADEAAVAAAQEAAFNEFFRNPMRDPPPNIPDYNSRMPRTTIPEPNGDFFPPDPRFRPGPPPPPSHN